MAPELEVMESKVPVILAVYLVSVILGSSLACFFLVRKRYKLSLIVFFLLLPAVLVSWYQATRADMVAAWLYPSDSIYASRFSPRQFQRVTEGMHQQELLELLGQPLERHTIVDRREYWHYSRHGARFQNYWNVIVIVDPTARQVVGRFREFYTD